MIYSFIKELALVEIKSFHWESSFQIQVQQWQQNMTTFQNEMSQNLSAIISALSPLKEQFMNILNNKDQTPQALLQSIMQLKNQSGAVSSRKKFRWFGKIREIET